MPVRERELELNSVKKSNTSGSGEATAALILGARFISHAYLLLIGHKAIAESLKMAELSRYKRLRGHLPRGSNRKSEEALCNPGCSCLETLCRMSWRWLYLEQILGKKLTHLLGSFTKKLNITCPQIKGTKRKETDICTVFWS